MSATVIAALIVGLATLVGFLLKLRPERTSIIAQAAERAVNAVAASMDELRHELAETRSELAETRAEVGHVKTELEQANKEIELLRESEVKMLEAITSVERRLREGRESAVTEVLEELSRLRRDLNLATA